MGKKTIMGVDEYGNAWDAQAYVDGLLKKLRNLELELIDIKKKLEVYESKEVKKDEWIRSGVGRTRRKTGDEHGN